VRWRISGKGGGGQSVWAERVIVTATCMHIAFDWRCDTTEATVFSSFSPGWQKGKRRGNQGDFPLKIAVH